MVRRCRRAPWRRFSASNRRRRRLQTAAALGGTFVLTYVTFSLTVGDSWTITDTLLALVGTLAMIAAPLFLLAGLLTPRTPDEEDLVRAR